MYTQVDEGVAVRASLEAVTFSISEYVKGVGYRHLVYIAYLGCKGRGHVLSKYTEPCTHIQIAISIQHLISSGSFSPVLPTN